MIYKRMDGSYLLDKGYGPATYHATKDGTPDEWGEAEAYAKIHPELVKDYIEPDYLKIGKIEAITTQLTKINLKAIRPIQSIMVGTHTQYDTDKLAELEAEADRLREELRRIENEQI